MRNHSTCSFGTNHSMANGLGVLMKSWASHIYIYNYFAYGNLKEFMWFLILHWNLKWMRLCVHHPHKQPLQTSVITITIITVIIIIIIILITHLHHHHRHPSRLRPHCSHQWIAPRHSRRWTFVVWGPTRSKRADSLSATNRASLRFIKRLNFDKSSKTIDILPVFFEPKWSPSLKRPGKYIFKGDLSRITHSLIENEGIKWYPYILWLYYSIKTPDVLVSKKETNGPACYSHGQGPGRHGAFPS